MPGSANPRVWLAILVILVAAVGIGVFAIADRGEDSDAPVRARLTLERSVLPTTGQPELLVSLPDERLNTLETTGGETSVLLQCVDDAGEVAVRRRHDWPLVEEAGFPPHIHQVARGRLLDRVRTCRLVGEGLDFSSKRITQPLPPAPASP
ncbi:MAG: hypothetical protein M3454_02605 [Actinomycetota bacterium]|nr:hypothetical protein [Actinomycetota bacterium]